MGKLKYTKKYNSMDVHDVLTGFIDRYVDREKLKRYFLMWNSFVCRPKFRIPIESIQNISLPFDKTVFFYEEREKMLYTTTMKDVVRFVENLEPWDQVDACVFDKDMNWVIAVTHEDVILCWGDIDKEAGE